MATAKTTKAKPSDRELAAAQASTVDEETKNDVKKAPVRHDTKTDEYFITAMGKEFKLADTLGLMAALKFSVMQDDDDVELDAMYMLLYSIIHEDSIEAFERHMAMSRAGGEEIGEVIAGAMESFSGRPTEEPAGS